MNLTCPSCHTTFEVSPEEIGQGGRTVRCGDCGHDWFQEQTADPLVVEKLEPPASILPLASEDSAPELGAPELVAPELVAPELGDPPSADSMQAGPRPLSRAPEQARASLARGWIILAIFVAGLGAGLYFGKDRIISAAPSAARLYQLAGLAQGQIGVGFELRQVTSLRSLVKGERVVLIQGLVANVANHSQTVPRLRAVVTDSDGVLVDQWTFSAADDRLPPGGTSIFETSTTDPPREVNVSISFIATD